jgi:hypothetical protein
MRLHIHCAALAAAAAVLGAGAQAAPAVAASAAQSGRAVTTTAEAGARSVAGAVPAGTTSAPAASPVLLINGTRLLVTPASGSSAVSVLPGSASTGLIGLRVGGQAYEIPADALPYLGNGLDLTLFNVTALQHAETSGRLPVRVSFAGAQPGLPGVTVTTSGRGTADGYLTASGAQAFGAALARQFAADHGSTGHSADGGLFAGGASLALAGGSAPVPAVSPAFPMHTLTVTATNSAGKADTGDLAVVLDAASFATFGDDPIASLSTFYDGAAKFSVPSGTYWVIGSFTNSTGTTFWADIHPEVDVSGTSTVHVAQSAATSPVTMVAPRPSVQQQADFGLSVDDAHSTELGISWSPEQGSGQAWVSPMTDKPRVGTLQAYAAAALGSPSTVKGTPYDYNLVYADAPGVIPAQHYQAQASSLAAVTERYYQDVTPATGFLEAAADFQDQGTGWFWPVTVPGTQVQYFSTASNLAWLGEYWYYVGSFTSSSPQTSSQADLNYRVLSAGSQVVDWNEYPLHPQPFFSYGGFPADEFPLVPSAIRTGNTLSVNVSPFSDNQPGHVGDWPNSGSTYQIEQNGTVISHGSANDGIPSVTLSAKPSVVGVTFGLNRTGPSFRLSTSTQTTWTWKSAPDPSATVPPSWGCTITLFSQPSRQCAVQPMMTLDYHIRGLGLNGAAPAGAQQITLNAGHIQLATATKITAATAQVSCNAGKTWAKATVKSAGSGNFTITYSEKSGCLVTTKVTATDSNGGSVSETIDNAYQVGS